MSRVDGLSRALRAAALVRSGEPRGRLLVRACREELERGKLQIAAMDGELRKQKEAADLREKADLITANMHRLMKEPAVRKGEKCMVKIRSYRDTEAELFLPIEIDLTKHHSLGDLVADMFKKAKRIERAPESLARSKKLSEESLFTVQEALRALGEPVEQARTSETQSMQQPSTISTPRNLADEVDMERLVRGLEEDLGIELGDVLEGLESKPSKQSAPAKKRKMTDGFWRLDVPSGEIIWVGKNKRANEDLSLKHSLATDIWMHARGFPGSHVIVRPKNPTTPVSEFALQTGADLAARHSKAGKGDSKVEVLVALAKYLRKPSGAPVGAVSVLQELPGRVGVPGRSPILAPEPGAANFE